LNLMNILLAYSQVNLHTIVHSNCLELTALILHFVAGLQFSEVSLPSQL